jgi:hypothetical protein
MARNGIPRIIYSSVILVLVIVNVFVIRGWFRKGPNSPGIFPFSNVGDTVDQIFVETNLSPRIRIPFENVAATVVYHIAKTMSVKGHLGLLRLISQSSLGQDVGIAIIADDPWDSEAITSSCGDRIHFIRDGTKILQRLDIPIPHGSVIVFQLDTVVYSGIVNERFLPAQLWDLQEQAKGVKTLKLPSIGELVYGKFRNHGEPLDIGDIPADIPILLFSSFCLKCGDNTVVNDIARLQGRLPPIVLPSIYNARDDLDEYLKYAGADSSYYNYYQLDLSTSNLNEDTFLQSFPVVLIIHGGRIVYLSHADQTCESILKDLQGHTGG